MPNRERLFWLIALMGFLCLVFQLIIPSDPKNALLLGFSSSRLLMALVLVLAVLASAGLAISLRRNITFGREVQAFIDGTSRWRKWGTHVVFFLFFCILAGIAFLAAWVFLYPHYSAYFLRIAPVILFISMLGLLGWFALRAYHDQFRTALYDIQAIWTRLDRTYHITWIFILLLFFYVGVTTYQLATRHAAEVNQELGWSDQKSYLQIAEKAYLSGFRYMGDRSRTPLFSYLLAVFYKPGFDQITFFEIGKQVNIALSIFLLAGIFFFMNKFLPTGQAALLAVLAAVSLYVYKAGYVQAENLFYSLSFASYVLMAWLLIAPTPLRGVAAGAVSALAYMTKALTLPSLVLFILVYLLQFFSSEFFNGRVQRENWRERITTFRSRLVILMLVFSSFLVVVFPYIRENKQLFGQYFYNVNTTFYMWYDDWDEVDTGTKAHGDSVGWPDQAPEELPSLSKYFRDHNPKQTFNRIIIGARGQLQVVGNPFGNYHYPLIYTLALLVLVVVFPRVSLQLLSIYRFPVLFALGYFIGYLVLFSWYIPIPVYHDPRLTYMLYLPYLFSIFVILNTFVKKVETVRFFGRSIQTASLLWILHSFVLGMALYNLLFIAPIRLLSRWYGK